MKYTVEFMTSFKKGYKRIKKQEKDERKLYTIVEKLANEEKLEAKYKDHALINTIKIAENVILNLIGY